MYYYIVRVNNFIDLLKIKVNLVTVLEEHVCLVRPMSWN